VQGQAQATLQGVFVDGVTGFGVEASSAAVTVTHCLIAGVKPLAGAVGVGVQVAGGAQVTVASTRVTRAAARGVSVAGAGTRAILTNCLIDGAIGTSHTNWSGHGMHVALGATVRLEQSRLATNRDVGLYATGPSSAVTVTESVIDGTRPHLLTGAGGMGVLVVNDAQPGLQRVVVHANRDAGLAALGENSRLRASGLIVRDTLPRQNDSGQGVGAGSGDGARMELAHAWLDHNTWIGLAASGHGSEIEARDVVVSRTQFSAKLEAGQAVAASSRGRVHIQRGLLDDTAIGATVRGYGSRVELGSVLVAGPGVATQGTIAGGVFADMNGSAAPTAEERALPPASAELQDVVMVGIAGAGVAAVGAGVSITAERLTVARTWPTVILDAVVGETSTLPGIGVLAGFGAVVNLADSRLSETRGAAAYAVEGCHVRVTTTVTDRTLGEYHTGRSGMGLFASQSGRITARSVRLHMNQAAGAWAQNPGAEIVLHDALVDATAPEYVSGNEGSGATASLGAALKVVGVRFHQNRRAGFEANGSGSLATSTGSLVDGTLPEVSSKLFGSGLMACRDGAELRWHTGRVALTRGASAFACLDAVLQVQDSVLSRVNASKLPVLDANGHATGSTELADGVAATSGSSLEVADSLVWWAPRAGVLCDSVPDARIERTAIHGNTFGLAWQHGTKLQEKHVVVIGAQFPRQSDGGIALPPIPPPVELKRGFGAK
jgi:hypothetical protein